MFVGTNYTLAVCKSATRVIHHQTNAVLAKGQKFLKLERIVQLAL
jgi:hypothetical protein